MTHQHTHAAGRRTGTTPSRHGGRPAADVRPLVPPRRGPGGRRLLAALLVVGLLASVLPWWWDTPAGSLKNSAATVTAAGRITGLVAGYLLLVQVLMMSRLRVLERWIGGEQIARWHRDVGATLLVAVLAHMSLILVGYADLEDNSVLAEAGVLLSDYEDMVSAFAAAAIMVLIGFTSMRAIRRALPYELWYHLHLASYVVLLLGFGHQFSNGAQLFRPGPVRTFWIAMYMLVVAALLWGRVVAPLLFNLRHRLRVADVVAESSDTISIYLTGDRLDRLEMLGGQFFRWRFLTPGCWWQSHPFSVSAAANGRWLRLTVKVVGSHTADLRDLDPGTRVWAAGPSGTFTAAHRVRERALLIAGGSGITPIRAMLEELPPGAALIYRASTPADVLLHRELDWLAQARHTSIWYVVGSRHDPGPREVMSPEGLRRLVPDVARRDVYLCGPPGLVEQSLRVLRQAGVPRRQIHLATFEL
ncbi:ferric reductase-like transmembrane domain-containing protein [Micromonospora phytophila]|uniref:ferredoxin reductase family protein n=1 Tax=Micromonospora phytophila TaxID=709888 RepID=UPI0020306F86|nr:ferric reductase-like transmembrane domain-containing protein [Micromonospora phytophila]MCM0677397.1 ferric reductase-like transmembrane domain-containing protein [Micromonospora phytophila]